MSKQIDEVMGLVNSYGLLCADYETDECDLSLARMEIETKLRELLPEGFVLVPTEPTEEMGLVYLQAARIHAADGAEDTMRFSYGGYKAMIAAAKKAPE